ncbi:hypothetical protein [Clostridium perfringens]|jgi:hypothetical protein|uniref:Terminase n=1 Tax=Clostridium perfringens TaxID=1502 RepID=A0AAW4J403_CLOPF|nr:hypothetical protein [Clostridium perfringens]MBO3356261.1 hypothetical protein [Clostridium perfringens]MBO3359398.1 hypothetical protein [Clostridium perfringens]
MASYSNYKNNQQKYKNSNDMSKRPMQVITSEDLNEQFKEKLINWTTFYRRNIHRFAEHYLGIQLHLYQKIMLYLMHLSPLVILLCARGIAKSFITALYACCVCILYPNSKILATALTKKQGGLLVTEKIQKELMVMSPNLRGEIKDIKTSQNAIEVVFHNGSSFIVSTADDKARGLRSTCLIIDEFRLVKKSNIDAILSPTEIIRQAPYIKKSEYAHLAEEPREIYLSSAYYKSSWIWQFIIDTVKDTYKKKAMIFATDYALTLKHGIRTKNQLLRERKKLDSVTFDMEYKNLMIGGSDNQYYTFDLLSEAQTIEKAWYPKTIEEYFASKDNNKYKRFGNIPKQKGEVRIVSMDIAMSKSTKTTKNDNSVIKCIRGLLVQDHYERQEVYTETFEGIDIDSQAIRVRQLMEDFSADYFVFDARTYGTNLTDSMAKTLYDKERDTEYPPIKVFNNENLADRCKNPSAAPIMWAFIGSSKSNHQMHTTMLGSLMNKKYKMLISHTKCREAYLMDKKEYEGGSPEYRAWLELAYMQSDLTLNEMINLKKNYVDGGNIKLEEPSTGTKDRYVCAAMGNLFIQEEFETKLTARTVTFDEEDDYVMWI